MQLEDQEQKGRTCNDCSKTDATSVHADSKLGLWVCEDCDKTLCHTCKKVHHENTEGQEENQETGEAKTHFVRPLKLVG